MQYDNYPAFHISDDLSVFDFISLGKNGKIHKRIAFMRTERSGVYNLAFGDIDEEGGIDDFSISDNGDRNKILATVAKSVDEFTKKYPRRWIIFRGSTIERTRLYRMAIGLNLEELLQRFDIYGQLNDEFLPFYKNMPTLAFLIKRKIV
ncbi:MAG TPA: hypothetical protein VGM30_17520 [Puia sp.]|jgi:hypothetical protein